MGRLLAPTGGHTVKGFPFKIEDVSGPTQRTLVYRSVDLSIELHIRISYSDFDLGEEELCWNSPNTGSRSSSPFATNVDLGIYSFRNYIVTIVQKAGTEADPEITRLAAVSVIEKLKGEYNAINS
ncbi:hypothetical protein [Cohnella fermenti]|uniref:Uncharacterized protein n=1 Tax=Cohnella fermenti TaxID=2565925 RepID=A0A4S4C961_9BACL|nr:hypothetical protein [Cohnella fermenti]THF84592.1 hypothetical protein E6C55_01000 [Cohnella fermenti]